MIILPPRVHKKERRRVYNRVKVSLKYKGHQTYFCVAVVITPCQVVVLNICRCTLYFKRTFTGRYTGVRYSLPFLIHSCCHYHQYHHRRRKILKVGGAQSVIVRVARAKFLTTPIWGSNHAHFCTIEATVNVQPRVSR